MTRHQLFSFLLLVGAPALFAQSGPTLVGAEYERPSAIKVAAGQLMKIRVAGLSVLSPESRFQQATTVPLPTTLAGISVRITQSLKGSKVTLPVALLGLEQIPLCADTSANSPDCFITVISIQIPFELTPSSADNAPATELIVSRNGVDSKAFFLFPVVDNIHVLTTCDFKRPGPYFLLRCDPVVAHADGNPVSAQSPARSGETLVIYAVGLGQTTPTVKTGEATPSPAPVLFSASPWFNRTVELQFDFRPNAGPTRPISVPNVTSPAPLFVGLTPGQVGLYQINVKLPDTFPSAVACGGSAQSNLTINIGGVESFDGAAICVQPPQ